MSPLFLIHFKSAPFVQSLFRAMAKKSLLGLAVLILGFQSLPSIAFGAEEGRSGPEWTFTNDQLIEWGRQREQNRVSEGAQKHDALQKELLAKWADLLIERCHHCKIHHDDYAVKVEYAPDSWFKIAKDLWVLEVTASPLTLTGLKQHRQILQKLIWNTAKDLNLKPHSRIGGGHIHLEIATFFNGDRLLFRNFIVDLANHPALFLGGIGFDLLNAPPIAVLSKEQRDTFALLIEQFDRGQMSIEEFKKNMNDQVYTKTFYPQYAHQRHFPDKYQAVNLSHGQTVELRGIKPELSADDHIKLVTLLQKRIEYLRQFTTPIPYDNKDYSARVTSTTERSLEHHTTDLPAQAIQDEVQRYVEESQLKWTDYSDLMTDELKMGVQKIIRCEGVL